jgi:hypothetical protein
MLGYALILFLHVSGALAIGAALGIEWSAALRLRQATTLETARAAMAILRPVRFIGGPAMLVLLATGGYMSGVRWGMQAWIVTALVGIVAMGALGGAIAGKRYGAIGAGLAQAREGLDDGVRQKLRDPAVLTSLHIRTGLLAGIIMLMTVHPGWMGSAAVLLSGGLLGAARSLRRPRAPEVVTA